jgi:Mannosyltransferase (PIG-V)
MLSAIRAPDRQRALACAWRAFWTSRLLVWLAGMVAVLVSGADAYRELSPGAPDPGDSLSGVLLSPARRWDSGWFLTIAAEGYDAPVPWRTAFFPGYPLLIRGVGEPIDLLGFAGEHAFELAAVLVSLAALLAALYFLHRLTEIELGPQAADNAVLLFAFFPTSFFLSAIYSEALFCALTIGCVYAARMGWWGRAALLGILASATRSQGVLLVVPLAIMLFWGPHAGGKPRLRDVAAVASVPLGVLAYMAYIRTATRYGLMAPFKAHDHWMREFRGPFVAVWEGVKEAGRAARDLVTGKSVNEPVSSVRSGLTNLLALAFGAVGVATAFRRLPVAYSAYALAGLISAVSVPPEGEALKSLPRLVIVLFPVFMVAGLGMTRWGRRDVVLAISAAGLAGFSAAFACGYWIA